jgi:hypothetical protein
MTICYVGRHYAAESGNLGAGTYADPYRPVTNPAVKTWLSTAPAGSVLCEVDALFGSTGLLTLDPADLRAAAKPGQPVILSGDPSRWGDAPAAAARAQRFGYKALSPSWSQVGSTGVYAATLASLRPLAGLAYNIDPRSDRAGVAQRDGFFERPALVFHPQDCHAVPHTACRARKAVVGAVVAGNTVAMGFPSSQTLTLTAVASGALDTPNSPGAGQFVATGTAATTAANLAAVINRAMPLAAAAVTDGFAAGAVAAYWTASGGTMTSDDKCGTGSGYTLKIADTAHGVWKTGQTKTAAQFRLKLRVDGASTIADGNALRLELAKNTTSGETFGLWLSRAGATYSIGANTSAASAAVNATIAIDTVYVIEARYDSDNGLWWLWRDGVEIASGVAGTGPLSVTDVGVKSVTGSGAATNWRVHIDDVRVWFDDTTKPHLRHASAWASGADVYLPQLIADTTTLTATNCTITADVWLVHLAGEADPAGKTWYGADASQGNSVDITPTAAAERAGDIVIADVETVASAQYNGLLGSSTSENAYPFSRVWTYRTKVDRPAYQCLVRGHDMIFDRVTWFDCPYTGPYLLLLSSVPVRPYDPAGLTYAKGFRDNIVVGARFADSLVFNSGALWNAATLCAPDIDAHSLGVQSCRDVIVDNFQTRATSDICIWFGGTANSFDGAAMCPTHRPDIGGEDRAFWIGTGRANQRMTGKLRFVASEDQHRRIAGTEAASSSKFGITTQQYGVPLDLEITGVLIKGWPYGAPFQALRLGVSHSGEADGERGVTVRGVAALWCGGGVKLGADNAQSLWPFHLYDTANPDRPITPLRPGVEQRRRPGAQWLGFYEESVAKSVSALAVAFTPGAQILAASMQAAGALTLWLRKTGSPGNITVSIGAGATPDVALAAATYTATITAASVSTAAGGASLAVTLSGSGTLAAGVKHWLILGGVAAASGNANFYQAFGWWGGRHPAFPSADYRSALIPAWGAESTDFSPYFTLATLGHAPSSAFGAPVFALGSSSANAKIAQKFRVTDAFRVSGLGVWLAGPVTANQASNMPVAIHADAAGEPGALVKRLLPMGNTQGQVPQWNTHEAGGANYAFPPRGCDLAANTDYWLVLDAPQVNGTNYYRMFGTVDGAADGYGAKVWNGSAWAWADGTAQDAAKLYFTLWQAPAGAGQTGPVPATAIDDVLVVSPRPTRNAAGAWEVGLYSGDLKVIGAGGVIGAPSFFFYCGLTGNRYAAGSAYDDWILTADFDAGGRPVLRGLVAVGKSPSFVNTTVFPAESADPNDATGGTTGLFRYANYELAASLAAGELHRGQLTPAFWAERSRAAGAEFGRDLLAIKGA